MPLALLVAARLLQQPEPENRADPLELTWEAPAGCPGPAEILRLHASLVSNAPSSPPARVRAIIEQRGTKLVESLEITVEGATEQRTLEGDDCIELAQATALLIAIAVDPIDVVETVDARGLEPLPELPDPPDPPAALPPVFPPPAAPLPRMVRPTADASHAPARWHLDAGLAAGPSWGAMPDPTGVVSVALGVERARSGGVRLRLGLDGRYTIPSTTAYPDRPELAARFDLWTIDPRACASLGERRVSVPLCAGLELGQLRARATGTADARTDRSPWIAATLAATLRWRIRGAWVVTAGLELGVPLRRERFHFEEHTDPTRQLHTVGPVTLLPHVGFGFQLF